MTQVPTLPSPPAEPPAPAIAGPQPRPHVPQAAVPGAPTPTPAVQDASCERVTNPAVNDPEIKADMEGCHFQIRKLLSDTVRTPTARSAGHPICLFAGISALSAGAYSYFSRGDPTIPTITTEMLGASASYLVSSKPAGITGMLGSILASFQTLLWPSKPMQSFQTGLEIIGLRKFEAMQILTIFPVMHLDQIIQISDVAFREALARINIDSLQMEMLTVAFSAFKGHLSELEDEIENSDISKYSRSIHRN
jgi:hypothetical protein